jgi:YVTN family beta-propeller protein
LTRRTYVRRRLGATALAVALLAAVFGAFRALSDDGGVDGTRAAAGTSAPDPRGDASGSAAPSPSPTGKKAAKPSSKPTATPAPDPTATPAPDPTATPAPVAGPPRRLTIRTHPARATVRVTDVRGRTTTGRAPYTVSVSGGWAKVVATAPGKAKAEQPVTLTQDRAVDVWLDPPGLLHHKIGEFRTGSNPKQVAFTPDSKEIWVTDLGGKGVEVFDARTFKKLKHIPLKGHGGVEVIFTRDGRTAYVSQMQSASVFEIDTATRVIRRQLMTGGSWTKVLLLSPDESRLYAANWSSDDVSELDTKSGKVLRRIKTVRTPRGLFLTADAKRLFVAGYEDGEIQRIRLSDGASRKFIKTGGAMRHMVGDFKKGVLYADDMAKDTVFAIDLKTEKLTTHSRTDRLPNTIDLTPDGKVLYVSNRGRNGPSYYNPGPEWGSVVAIDTATGKMLDAIVGGNQTTGLDVSPDGKLLAYSDFLDNRVCIYTIPSYDVLLAGNGGRSKAHKAELEK